MPKTDVAWKVGGEQGEGIDSTGDMLATIANRLGYFIYNYRLFSSRIKGGHSNSMVRIGTAPIHSAASRLDILVAFDQKTIDVETVDLVSTGLVIADPEIKPQLPEGAGGRLLTVPLKAIADELGAALVRTTVATGVSAFLLGLDIEAVAKIVRDVWARKGEKVQNLNEQAIRRGYTYALEHFPDETHFALGPSDGKGRLLMTGNEAVGLGALAAGCRLCIAYPITPASDVLEWLQPRLPKVGGIALQAEDELASINAIIGGGFAGVRAITATSGPGLSLMQEAIGLAHNAEIPLVIVDCQRGGPSTGMPTKHEQSDLLALCFGSHGDTPRIILAPSSAEEAFYDAVDAFNLAEKYQMPVFIAQDLSVALNNETVEQLDYDRITIERGEIATKADLDAVDGSFKRFDFTPSGISKRALPGQPGGMHPVTGLEHDVFGRVSENPENRVRQMNKRFNKLDDFAHPGFTFAGDEGAEVLLVGWGASRGAIDEACAALDRRGIKAAHLHMRVLAPFPSATVAPHVAAAKHVFIVENNATGQLAQLFKLHVPDALYAGGKSSADLHSVLKYNGYLFIAEEIVSAVEGALQSAAVKAS